MQQELKQKTPSTFKVRHTHTQFALAHPQLYFATKQKNFFLYQHTLKVIECVFFECVFVCVLEQRAEQMQLCLNSSSCHPARNWPTNRAERFYVHQSVRRQPIQKLLRQSRQMCGDRNSHLPSS